MIKLSPQEEIQFKKEILKEKENDLIFQQLISSFGVLQVRSQMLLGLVTICLTITGFSGIRIAASSDFAKIALATGVMSVLITSLLLMLGPLKVQWLTQHKEKDVESTIAALIERRDKRTQIYHTALGFLFFGLASYVTSLASYLSS